MWLLEFDWSFIFIPATTVAYSDVSWTQVDHDVYVANISGEFAGFVAIDDEGNFTVYDSHSTELAQMSSMIGAFELVESLVTHRLPGAASSKSHATRFPRRNCRGITDRLGLQTT